MSKKDRIALVISAIYILFPIAILFGRRPEEVVIAILPLLIYWGYRFIKNDISFLNDKGKDNG